MASANKICDTSKPKKAFKLFLNYTFFSVKIIYFLFIMTQDIHYKWFQYVIRLIFVKFWRS